MTGARHDWPRFLPVRVAPLGLTHLGGGLWQYVDTSEPGRVSQVGPIYKSKGEALADLDRHARDSGWLK